MKKKEYIPQFEYNDDDNYTPPPPKPRRVSTKPIIIRSTEPDWQKFMEYQEAKATNSYLSNVFLIGLIWRPLKKYGLGGWTIALGIINLLEVIAAIVSQYNISYIIIRLCIAVFFFAISYILIQLRKRRLYKKFMKFNSLPPVYPDITDYPDDWFCRCCNTPNIGNCVCHNCGIYPNFDEIPSYTPHLD